VKNHRSPSSGDLVEVLISERDTTTGELDHCWKSGMLLEVSQNIDFENLLWVEVLVGGEKIITTPNKIEIISRKE